MLNRRTFLSAGTLAIGAPAILKGATAPLSTFGILADAQYADVPAEGSRFYRNSVAKLGDAIENYNRQELAFCIHLGDLIDRDWNSFDAILKPLQACRHPVKQVLGNHDFDVQEDFKPRVPQRLGMPQRFYHFDREGFRFMVLDTTDLSTYGNPAASPEHAAAGVALEKARKANLPQAKPWNGGLGAAQMLWLERLCAEAAGQKLKVILFAHHPVFPANALNIWNSDELLALAARHPHVVASFNGHNHEGNFGEQEGLPFVNLRGMVETANTTAYATASLHADRLILTGQGRETSRELVFRPQK